MNEIQLPPNMKMIINLVFKTAEEAKQGWDELEAEWYKVKGNGHFEKDRIHFELSYDPNLKEIYRQVRMEEIDSTDNVLIKPKVLDK